MEPMLPSILDWPNNRIPSSHLPFFCVLKLQQVLEFIASWIPSSIQPLTTTNWVWVSIPLAIQFESDRVVFPAITTYFMHTWACSSLNQSRPSPRREIEDFALSFNRRLKKVCPMSTLPHPTFPMVWKDVTSTWEKDTKVPKKEMHYSKSHKSEPQSRGPDWIECKTVPRTRTYCSNWPQHQSAGQDLHFLSAKSLPDGTCTLFKVDCKCIGLRGLFCREMDCRAEMNDV